MSTLDYYFMYIFDSHGKFIDGDRLEYMLNLIEDAPNCHLNLGEDVLGEYNCEMCYNCNYNYDMEV